MNSEESKFIEAQPEVKQALIEHRKRWAKVQQAKHKIMEEARKVVALVTAFDCCVEVQWNHDDIPKKHDKLLKKYTNKDSEAWFWELNFVGDTLKESILRKCVDVSTANYFYKKLEQESRDNKELERARSKARKKFREQNQE